ncbi:hypothetical protein [Candidatus Mycoplasma haematohominis]|uniref:Uncharacterized protein n=1 Tax=Candidatus Mycoplasma haematohominis TaxID=1494318 RepID=A0A478FQI8_9MOLU|nr:hypothetical protein [Candidatus Mycoplasma haemohominis]GCE63723.1 hypothetical protein MHSWG343_07230 [Candidatus Mycoplasma haemohominis]
MTPQAIGGGGTLAAYAAGAFDKPTYYSQAVKDNETKDKEYIGGDIEKIKTALGETTEPKYSDTLKGVWDQITSTEESATLSKPTETKDTLFSTSISADNKEKIVSYTLAWCGKTSKKELATVPEGNNNNSTWNSFKKACFHKSTASA